MTYTELLAITAEKKLTAVRDINKILHDDSTLGFLAKAEIERDPGRAAWTMLAREFCETLAENFSEIYESADEWDQRELSTIYMMYEDGDPDIYYSLPYEAQLFEV